jgi:hypothetical protein
MSACSELQLLKAQAAHDGWKHPGAGLDAVKQRGEYRRKTVRLKTRAS